MPFLPHAPKGVGGGAANIFYEREKKILTLRFLVGKTQMEVASEVGISQAQVSRLEKYAMDKIKGHV